MERSIMEHVLKYLLEHEFPSKAEMARQLGIQQRTMERTFQNLEASKASRIALNRSLEYCALHRISLDAILERFAEEFEEKREADMADKQAFQRLILDMPENLSEEGKEVFHSMNRFLQQASAQMCPYCETWCNPWDGKRSAEDFSCCIGFMAREIVKDTAEFYTEKGEEE